MTVALTLKDGHAAFTERGPIHVAVPDGSEVLPVCGFAPGFAAQLFVPGRGRLRIGWSAANLLRAAREGRFKIV